MRALHRKLLRDLAHLRGQGIAIGLVMMCGVATFVMSVSMLDSLKGTIDAYYERSRFAQVFAHLERAPLRLVERIAAIPGVAYAQPRIVERVLLDMPGLAEPASGRIVSIPDDPRAGLNLVHLRTGRYPSRASAHEVLVSQRFAEAHGLLPGDSVRAVLNGRMESLRVVGTALSPEFVYLISPGGVLPQRDRFGVLWMHRDEMEAAFDMDGAFNDLLLSLAPGANREEVIDRVDALTERYGGLGAYGREDQSSNEFLENEIRELRGMALIVPTIFLGVSAFLLNIALSRLVDTQREQIATLKAIGYSTREIGVHYLGFALVITVLAAAAGSLVGSLMGQGLTGIYIEFFDFPTFEYVLRWRVVLLAVLVSGGSSLLGVAQAVRSAVGLPPAEAMRPKAPPSFRPTVLERLGLHRVVRVETRMVLRQLERAPFRTGLSIAGIALATAVLVVGSFGADSFQFLLDHQFNRVQRYDIDVALMPQTDGAALSSIAGLAGVRRAEPYRGVAVRLRNGHLERRLGIIGLERGDGLFHLIDLRGDPVELPQRGLVLATVLGEVLGVEVGDRVRVEVLEGRRPVFETRVAGFIDTMSGLSAYMHLDELNRRMREPDAVSGAYLQADSAHIEELYAELNEAPRVLAVNVKSAVVENFRETIQRNIDLARPFMVGFSMVIAFGVVYNSARISLAERGRDLATLRVLGFTRREVSAIQLGELAILTIVAIPIGLVAGWGLAWYTAHASASELIRIPFVIHPSTLAFAGVVIAVASLVSGLIVRGRLDRLDMVSVLKSRE
ncbi:MAG: ABC transporter permease [Phycisphaerales bacterium JB037]